MPSEFRQFVKDEYTKVVAKEQKAQEDAEKEELTNRQKGARKGAATKANNRFLDMLKKKVKDEETPETPETPEAPEAEETQDVYQAGTEEPETPAEEPTGVSDELEAPEPSEPEQSKE